MIYRRFGRTNLQMPVFSCGGMRYQFKWGEVPADQIPADNQANLEATIRRALDVGVNHIETARGYGSSEMQLGRILPTLPRDKMIVQTKVAPCEDPKQFVEMFNTSMDRLKLDYVDLLAIHGINTREMLTWSIRPNGCLAAARKLQKEGRCRWVGFSTHAPLDVIIQAIHAHIGEGFDYINLHWYYILQHNWPAILEATKRDMGIFIISPSDKGGKLYAPPKKLVDLCAPLHPMTFNDLFCLRHPQVHTLSIGAARPSDFDLHLEALPLMERAGEVLPAIQKRLEDAMQAATGVRHPEAMSGELPDHETGPAGINIATIVWLRNLARGWDMTDYGKMRYNLLGSGGHWFPGKNVAGLNDLAPGVLKRAVAASPWANTVEKMLREAHEMLGAEAVKRLSQS